MTDSYVNEMRVTRAAVVSAGFSIPVNQAGPLLEQMALRGGEVRINTVDSDYCVAWQGRFAYGSSAFEAAMRCIQRTYEKEPA